MYLCWIAILYVHYANNLLLVAKMCSPNNVVDFYKHTCKLAGYKYNLYRVSKYVFI